MFRVFLLLGLGAGVLASPVARADTVRIAVLAFQGAERASRDFEPTVAYLNQALPRHRFEMLSLDPIGIEQAVAQQRVDFVVTNPGDYVELEAEHGVTRLATLESHDHAVPTDTVGSTVIVPNRPGHAVRFADLQGQRLAVVSADAFGGWRVVWREMLAAQVNPLQLKSLVVTEFPMSSVISAVREGRADAGVLRTCLLEDEIAAGRVEPGEFAVVAEIPDRSFPCRRSSRLYPDWPFARLATTSPGLAKAVTASLLSMPAVDGRAWTAPLDYTSVHALFRELKIGPYAYLARTSVSDYVRGHWQWFVAALLAALWWVLHVVRVETLVRRRTVELTRAIEGREAAEHAARQHREERDQFSRLGILGEMASNIAHELNQPLAAITNYAEGITRVIDAGRIDPAFIRNGARGIAGQAERAGVIIRRIRGFVRRREVQREPLDINHAIRETLAIFEGQAQLRGVPLHVRLEQDLPRIMGDLIEIEQVLLNLLQNALDVMDGRADKARGITVSSARVHDAVDAVEVCVRDRGAGLSAEVEAQLFEPFFTTKPHGLGLGLSICRTIVESHGGHLWATNEPDGGVSMCFTLPLSSGDM